jgi:hypothetical protein
MSFKPFIYDPLLKGSIRILTLFPGDKSSKLHGELHPVEFHLSADVGDPIKVRFDALSYT